MGRTSKYPNKAGIYKLTCDVNNKIYIGKSVNIRLRMVAHKYSKSKKIKSGLIERAITKHGWASFRFEVLELMEDFDKARDNPKLLEMESDYIKKYNSTNIKTGYNICSYSSDSTGIPRSNETKEKIRIANTGRKVSEETKQRMRDFYTDAQRERVRQTNTGKKHSEETKAKMKESSAKLTKDKQKRQSGKPLSEETKRKLSEANKGKPQSKNTLDAVRNRIPKKYTVQNPNSGCFEIINMAKFCRDQNLGRDSMDRLVRGIITNYMGWTFVEAVVI